MRILFVAASYPPHEIGGWAQLTRDFREALQERGHNTAVLCSNYKAADSECGSQVYRRLYLETDPDGYYDMASFLGMRWRKEQDSLREFRTIAKEFCPDVILINEMWNLSRAIPWQAEQLYPNRVVYYVADTWPHSPSVHENFWRMPAHRPLRRFPKKLLGVGALGLLHLEQMSHPLRMARVICVSQTLKEIIVANLRLPAAEIQVIRNGIDLALFSPRIAIEHEDGTVPAFSLLYAGSVSPEKGVETTIEAMNKLNHQAHTPPFELTILGAGHHEYRAFLERLVATYGLDKQVRFAERVGREQMPKTLCEFDVLLFPSLVREGLPRIVVEAMASGLGVLGTATGGSRELLQDGETGLTFEPGNPTSLAQQINRWSTEPLLRRQIRRKARRFVEQWYDFRKNVDELEEYLTGVSRSQNEY